jgi:hypothetical protein
MKICADHWLHLRAAIEERGLAKFVARSGEDALAVITARLHGVEPTTAFEPLMNANFAIWARYTEGVGMDALAFEGCPLCEVEAFHTGLAQDWIDGSAEDQLAHARHIGLVPAVQ